MPSLHRTVTTAGWWIPDRRRRADDGSGTVVPDPIPSTSEVILPYEVSKYEENGYGRWHYGPGVEDERRLDLLPVDSHGTSATDATRLLKFFTITDIHITDEESPAQAIFIGYKGGKPSGRLCVLNDHDVHHASPRRCRPDDQCPPQTRSIRLRYLPR